MTVLVDLGIGNLHSARKAFARVAEETGAGPVAVTTDPEAVRRADRVVLPGDGAFRACMGALDALPEMREALEEARGRGAPILGICVGMQMLARVGHEHGATPGLGWIGGEVVRIEPGPGLKVPHMGWNDLRVRRAHPLLEGVRDGDHAYFVHSWRFAADDAGDVLAEADHGGPVAAVVGRDSVAGTQFHPEKSQATGLRIVANFLAWRP